MLSVMDSENLRNSMSISIRCGGWPSRGCPRHTLRWSAEPHRVSSGPLFYVRGQNVSTAVLTSGSGSRWDEVLLRDLRSGMDSNVNAKLSMDLGMDSAGSADDMVAAVGTGDAQST